jgi:hypothetical protein
VCPCRRCATSHASIELVAIGGGMRAARTMPAIRRRHDSQTSACAAIAARD